MVEQRRLPRPEVAAENRERNVIHIRQYTAAARRRRAASQVSLRGAAEAGAMTRCVAVLLLLAFSGCASGAQSPVPYMRSGTALRALSGTGAGKITHVIYIVQENRSFDNLFQGYPGANTVSSGPNSQGKTITLQPATLEKVYQIDHSAYAMFAACNGTGSLPGTDCRMNGFNNEESYGGPPNPQYVYVPHNESKPYFDMAHEWVVADNMFQSHLDESFVSHQYVIAAQAQSSVDLPDSLLWAPVGLRGRLGDRRRHDHQEPWPLRPLSAAVF
jgi:phospholipase C